MNSTEIKLTEAEIAFCEITPFMLRALAYRYHVVKTDSNLYHSERANELMMLANKIERNIT